MIAQSPSIADDRALGSFRERSFCELLAQRGWMFTPLQLQIKHNGAASAYQDNERIILPDIAVWRWPLEFHEIKHKAPVERGSRAGHFGLEAYRFDSLLRFSRAVEYQVYYTIHRHDMPGAGGRDGKTNDLSHWLTVAIADLVKADVITQDGPSWRNGEQSIEPIHYWPVRYWRPLPEIWADFG